MQASTVHVRPPAGAPTSWRRSRSCSSRLARKPSPSIQPSLVGAGQRAWELVSKFNRPLFCGNRRRWGEGGGWWCFFTWTCMASMTTGTNQRSDWTSTCAQQGRQTVIRTTIRGLVAALGCGRALVLTLRYSQKSCSSTAPTLKSEQMSAISPGELARRSRCCMCCRPITAIDRQASAACRTSRHGVSPQLTSCGPEEARCERMQPTRRSSSDRNVVRPGPCTAQSVASPICRTHANSFLLGPPNLLSTPPCRAEAVGVGVGGGHAHIGEHASP